MTRKDFELLARIIKGLPTRDVEPDDTRTTVARIFAQKLDGSNAGFDRARFLKACGDAMRSATADWIGSDSPNKPQHYKVVANVMGRFLRPMHSGDYLARNVKLARARLLEGFQPQRCGSVTCVGPEHDH